MKCVDAVEGVLVLTVALFVFCLLLIRLVPERYWNGTTLPKSTLCPRSPPRWRSHVNAMVVFTAAATLALAQSKSGNSDKGNPGSHGNQDGKGDQKQSMKRRMP